MDASPVSTPREETTKAFEQDSPSTQEDYQRRLAQMYRNNSRESQPEKLKRLLFAYFTFLERAVSRTPIVECSDDDFTIAELEALNAYHEAMRKRHSAKRFRPDAQSWAVLESLAYTAVADRN